MNRLLWGECLVTNLTVTVCGGCNIFVTSCVYRARNGFVPNFIFWDVDHELDNLKCVGCFGACNTDTSVWCANLTDAFLVWNSLDLGYGGK